MRLVLTCAFALSLLTACSVNTTQSRISRNGAMYSLLSAEHRSLVASGQIIKGMSKDAVYLAWGSPSRIFKLEEEGKPKERWVYTRSEPVTTTTFGVGYGTFPRYRRWGYDGCIFGGPQQVYVSEQYASVVFSRDKVESWEKKQ